MAIDQKEKQIQLSESARKRRNAEQITFKNIKGRIDHHHLLACTQSIMVESTPSYPTKPSLNDTWAQFQQLLQSIFHKQELKMSLQQAYEVRKDDLVKKRMFTDNDVL